MRKHMFWMGMCLCLFCFPLYSQAQFMHDLSGSALPWTADPVIQGSGFRFVVVGDLTGGEQAGVFDRAIQRINDLAPDFVITVGDVVE